jgi:outer membrane biosynthesis protein TonB
MAGTSPVTMLNIPLLEERFGRSFLVSLSLHLAFAAAMLLLPRFLPRPQPLLIGSGPGGGIGGESYAVGVVDEVSGGAGMVKPSIIPQPPALVVEQKAPEVAKEVAKKEAIALPDTAREKKPPPAPKKAKGDEKKSPPSSVVVPTQPQPGAGGMGGVSAGSGGGRGGGNGVSIGTGSGGFGDSWYARVVESRISSNWIRPSPGIRVEIVFSFYIASDGAIFDVKKEKSSGNDALDLTAERAIRASNPLAAPPLHLRGRPLQFIAEFVYPPNE